MELASRGERVARLLWAQELLTPALKLTLLDDARAHDEEYVLGVLRQLHAQAPFDAMLIACDPRQRDAYFTFGCQSRTAIFVDKPVFARDGLAHWEAAAIKYGAELLALEERVRAAGIDFVVQAQRRDHVGYRFVSATLEQYRARLGVPLTSIQIQHADGMWVLPGEWERDYHPYKFGFGKLLHSGYHFIDLLAVLLAPTLREFAVTSVEVAAKATFAADSLAVWAGHPLLPADKRQAAELDRAAYGEQDVFALLDFHSAERSICVADLALLQNSLADRDPALPVKNPYKGIGRVRHERVDLKLGSLLNIQVHSYQSSSTREPAGSGAGEVDHFDILLFRNKHLLGEPAFEKITLHDLDPAAAVAHNEHARRSLLKRFLRRQASGSELRSHLLTGVLTSLIYRAIARSRGGLGVLRATESWLP